MHAFRRSAFLLAAAVLAAPAAAAAADGQVVVARGQPVEIAFTADTIADPWLAQFSVAFRNAIAMAIAQHPTVRGFSIRVNEYETSCAGDDTAPASAIVAHRQNVAVIGDICSAGLMTSLPVYEAGGVVEISGSASSDALPGTLGPTVFNRTIVRDGDGEATWYDAVKTLSSDVAWAQEYASQFGPTPPDFADLYYDAANLLLARLRDVSYLSGGSLVIDRAQLAQAVRDTVNFHGVSCSITLDPLTGNRVNDANALARCTDADGE